MQTFKAVVVKKKKCLRNGGCQRWKGHLRYKIKLLKLLQLVAFRLLSAVVANDQRHDG